LYYVSLLWLVNSFTAYVLLPYVFVCAMAFIQQKEREKEIDYNNCETIAQKVTCDAYITNDSKWHNDEKQVYHNDRKQ